MAVTAVLGVLVGTLAVAMASAPASAQVASPAITPARITVESAVLPGEPVELPSLAVRNQGDTTLAHRMSALPAADGGDGASTGADAVRWVRFEPAEFVLQPGEVQPVTLTLAVPAGVEVSAHRLLLQAAVVAAGDGEQLQVSVGAGVATVLEFTVGEPGPRGAGLVRFWPLLLVAILAGAVAHRLAALADRIEWQSPVRRKPPGALPAGDPPEADAVPPPAAAARSEPDTPEPEIPGAGTSGSATWEPHTPEPEIPGAGTSGSATWEPHTPEPDTSEPDAPEPDTLAPDAPSEAARARRSPDPSGAPESGTVASDPGDDGNE